MERDRSARTACERTGRCGQGRFAVLGLGWRRAQEPQLGEGAVKAGWNRLHSPVPGLGQRPGGAAGLPGLGL